MKSARWCFSGVWSLGDLVRADFELWACGPLFFLTMPEASGLKYISKTWPVMHCVSFIGLSLHGEYDAG